MPSGNIYVLIQSGGALDNDLYVLRLFRILPLSQNVRMFYNFSTVVISTQVVLSNNSKVCSGAGARNCTLK